MDVGRATNEASTVASTRERKKEVGARRKEKERERYGRDMEEERRKERRKRDALARQTEESKWARQKRRFDIS